jgi:hypothetical protein
MRPTSFSWLAAFLFLSCIQSNPARSQALMPLPDAGSMTFGEWRFDWEIGSTNQEGLVIRNVTWRQTKVLHKASMPVIRVKYRGNAQDIGSGCGPYRDRIHHGNLSRVAGQTSNVVSRMFGPDVLEIAVFSEIGGYDLWQAYYFHRWGRLEPVLYSSGWSCNDNRNENDHRHHPYWRLDFDVVNAANRIQHVRTDSQNTTFIGGYPSESGYAVPAGTRSIVWTITAVGANRQVEIRSPRNELGDPAGSPWFGFSQRDVKVRRYHGQEDVGWQFGSTEDLGYFTPAEPLDDQDGVFWVIGHLSHAWSPEDEANPQWHSVGWTIDPRW